MEVKQKFMNKIPDGFKKMQLTLLLKNDKVETMEMKVLYFLVRDYYIFYSKVPEHGSWIRFYFFCREKDESSITYQLGIYMGLVFNNDMTQFENPIHRVPDGFPGCIEIKNTVTNIDNYACSRVKQVFPSDQELENIASIDNMPDLYNEVGFAPNHFVDGMKYYRDFIQKKP